MHLGCIVPVSIRHVWVVMSNWFPIFAGYFRLLNHSHRDRRSCEARLHSGTSQCHDIHRSVSSWIHFAIARSGRVCPSNGTPLFWMVLLQHCRMRDGAKTYITNHHMRHSYWSSAECWHFECVLSPIPVMQQVDVVQRMKDIHDSIALSPTVCDNPRCMHGLDV